MTRVELCDLQALGEEAGDGPIKEPLSDTIGARAEAVSAVAARFASAVDREARFPAEAIAAARAQRLLGIMVPPEHGGEGARLSDVLNVCYRLARACASTAMIFAMHQIKIACLVRHAGDSLWHGRLLQRVCAEQLLLASSTTEGQGGGNVRSSVAPIERSGSRMTLERRATVISYGAHADGVVTTARRSADAASSDQVLVAFLKEDYSLEPILAWDALGMRGTCSEGFTLKASGDVEQILPVPYETIHVQTMTPVAHLAWTSVWAGIAAAAVERARAFVRSAARKANGQLPPGAAHVTQANASLRVLFGLIAATLREFEQASADASVLASLDFQTTVNFTKVEGSELALSIVMDAFRACGLSGYRNDTEASLGRHLRDILSAPIMINNDRIRANVQAASLMSGIPTLLVS